MAESLARKYRPQTLEGIVGHEIAVNRLRYFIDNKEVPEALLISGPTGVGKTTISRILLRYFNCETLNACGECNSCKKDPDHHPDYKEMNGGDVGVKEARSLAQQAKNRPRYNLRIMVIDESHLMTKDAKTDLLKPIEEPPEQTMWVLATSNPSQLPETLIGRCQHLSLDRITYADVAGRIKYVAGQEGIDFVDDEVADSIARESGAHVRDALQVLEAVKQVGASNKDEALKQIVKIGGEEVESLSTSLLISLYGGKIRDTLGVLAGTTDYTTLLNRAIQFNQYAMDVAVKASGDNVWSSAPNRRFLKEARKHIKNVTQPSNLDVLAEVNEVLVEARGSIHYQTHPRPYLTNVFYNTAKSIRRKKQKQKSKEK